MVEIIVAAAIVVLVVTAASQIWILYFKLSRTSSEKTQSALLTEEAAEYFSALRNSSWDNLINPLPLNTPIFLTWNGTAYSTSTTAVSINEKYSASATFSALYRNTDNDISSTGTLDPNSKHMKIRIMSSDASTVYAETDLLIHDLFQN